MGKELAHADVKLWWFVVTVTTTSNMVATMVMLSNVKNTVKLRDTETVMGSLEEGCWKSID